MVHYFEYYTKINKGSFSQYVIGGRSLSSNCSERRYVNALGSLPYMSRTRAMFFSGWLMLGQAMLCLSFLPNHLLQISPIKGQVVAGRFRYFAFVPGFFLASSAYQLPRVMTVQMSTLVWNY